MKYQKILRRDSIILKGADLDDDVQFYYKDIRPIVGGVS